MAQAFERIVAGGAVVVNEQFGRTVRNWTVCHVASNLSGAMSRSHLADRRTTRARDLIEAAQLSLILSRGYDATGVQDICDRADVSRSTFYAHYRSRDDLKRSAMQHLHRQLAACQQAARASLDGRTCRPFAFGLSLFEHAREYLPLYRSMAGSRDRKVALDHPENAARAGAGGGLFVHKQTGRGIASARHRDRGHGRRIHMAVLIWWLDRGARIEPAEIDAALRRLLGGGAPW